MDKKYLFRLIELRNRKKVFFDLYNKTAQNSWEAEMKNSKNILIYCTTPFQVMMAIHYKRSVLLIDTVDIAITDHISQHGMISNKLSGKNLFRTVYDLNVFDLDYHQGRYLDLRIKGGASLRSIHIAFQREIIIREILKLENSYDEFWSSDVLESSNLIYDYLKSMNYRLKAVFYEEGAVSTLCDQNNQFGVEPYGKISNWKRLLYKISGEDMLYGNYDRGYSSVLDLADWESYFPVLPIPKLDMYDAEYIRIINDIWGYSPTDEYVGKFIFFEESFALNGIANTDIEIVKDLCDTVGRENVVLKLHPRSRNNRFSNMRIETNQNTGTPWELIALNTVGNNNVLLSISSGSLIHPQLYWGIDQTSICLVDCEEYKFPQLEKKYYRTFSKVCREKMVALTPHNFDAYKKVLLEYRGRLNGEKQNTAIS